MANETQKLAVRILETHIADGRIASSYIFSGLGEGAQHPEMAANGSDIKEEFAIAFACALENGNQKLFTPQDSVISQRIRKHHYPDVRWLGEDLAVRSIKIEAMRELIQWAWRKPFEGSWKICIVPKAERLTEEAANAFLKTLEEPPQRTVFCLLVDNKENLSETIQSRSFEIRLMATSLETVSIGNAADALSLREIFETYPSLARDEVKQKLDALMRMSRDKIYRLALQESGNEKDILRWIEALDLFYDSKSALDMNVNQKLMVTRLVMRLRRIFPSQKVVL